MNIAIVNRKDRVTIIIEDEDGKELANLCYHFGSEEIISAMVTDERYKEYLYKIAMVVPFIDRYALADQIEEFEKLLSTLNIK